MKKLVVNLNKNFGLRAQVVACCCGHGIYPMSIIVKEFYTLSSYPRIFLIWDLCSDKLITRTKGYYKRDKQGYYYIPEVIKNEL